MALPSSGVLTLDDIQTEFGGTNPIDLSDYYRGGSLVPDTATNAGIPTSGVISVTDFYGATNVITLDFVRRTQYTPTSSTTISGVAIGAANPNRMVILQNSIFGSNLFSAITACTIGGITATIISGTPQVVYAKVPTGTTADIVLTFSNTNQKRIQVNTINTQNSAPTFTATASSTAGTTNFTQNPVDPEGVFMWGFYHSAGVAGIGTTAWTLGTTSAGGVDVVPGYVNPNPSSLGNVPRSTMAISETSNSDSRNVNINQNNSPKFPGSYSAAYFQAN